MVVGVTGGTGFVGQALVRELSGRGHRVRVLARRDRGEGTFVPGDVVTGEGLDALLSGCDVLVHLVGIIRPAGRQTFDAVHRGGTANALDAARRHGVGRVLHMSALGARGDAPSAYHRSKWQGEQAVRASGLAWTIFRPSIIYGPGDAFVSMLANLIRRFPLIPVFGGGKNRMQPVAVEDVASAFGAAVGDPRTEGKVYELGGREVVTYADLLGIIARVVDRRPWFLPLPMGPVRGVVGALERMGVPLPVTRDQLLMLGEDNVRTGGAPLEELGLSPGPLEEGIRRALIP